MVIGSRSFFTQPLIRSTVAGGIGTATMTVPIINIKQLTSFIYVEYTVQTYPEKRCGMESNKPLTVSNYKPEARRKRVLLCNPPVYDIRFPWSKWHQPVSLLQLSTLLQRQGDEVRLFDTLSSELDAIPRRRRMRVLTHDGISLNWWRFGRLPSEFTSRLVAFRREGWQPDDVYIEGFTTFWWEGVAEMTATIRKYFPHTRIILFGAYPRLAPDHAAQHSNADILVMGQIEGIANQPLDLSLYPSLPPFTYLSASSR
jgi:hypothetical protein